MAKIKIDVISGFLGAGKTTLLSKYVSYRIKTGERVAIIENEFGEVGIDSLFLKAEGLSVYELINGCICCSLKGDIISTLQRLAAEGNLNRVIIEPTGVFMLNEIYEIIGLSDIASQYEVGAVVTVVDCKNYLKQEKKYNWFFTNQIKWAHRLILSKVGLVDKDTVVETILSLQKISDTLDIEAGRWDAYTVQDWERLFTSRNTSSSDYLHCDHCKDIGHHHSNHHEGFEGISIHCSRSFSKYSLAATVKMLSSGLYGDIPRAKGIVADETKGFMEFDFVNGDLDIRYKVETPEKELVSFIGTGIQKDMLSLLF